MISQYTQTIAPGWGWPAAPGPRKNLRQILVSYAQRLHPKAEYRGVFEELAKAFSAKFVFLDESPLSLEVPQRFVTVLRASRFGIFDVSGWDPNVLLELGIALGLNERTCVVAQAGKAADGRTPTDLRGLERVQYNSYAELQDYLFKLLSDELPVPRSHEVERQVEALREHALELIHGQHGLRINDIANLLGVSVDMAKLIVKPLVGSQVRLEGAARGARYYPLDAFVDP